MRGTRHKVLRVQLCVVHLTGKPSAACELDLTPSALAQWVRQAPADGTKGNTGLTTEERQRLKTLSPIELFNQVVKLRLIMLQESR